LYPGVPARWIGGINKFGVKVFRFGSFWGEVSKPFPRKIKGKIWQ